MAVSWASMASASASGDTSSSCRARDVAMSAMSGGKEACPTLTPIPTTSHAALPSGSREDSVRMPQSFLPCSTTSLHHLMPQSVSQRLSTARHTATAASGVTVSSCPAGQSCHRAERYRPPSGDWNERPSRPLPAVCARAMTAVLSSPCAARALHTLLVESTVS